jgi:hypothetical protein
MPARVRVDGDSAQGAPVRREGWSFTEGRLDERPDAGFLDNLQELEERAGRVGRLQRSARPHPAPPSRHAVLAASAAKGTYHGDVDFRPRFGRARVKRAEGTGAFRQD